MKDYEDYTPEQVEAIRKAIIAGREAMGRHGLSPEIFLDAFIKAGGVRIPGQHYYHEDLARRIGSHALMSLGGRPTFTDEPDEIRDTVRREINRAHSEVYWRTSSSSEDAVAFRFVYGENARDQAVCARFAEADAFGLGPGLVPGDAIVVLPVGCDRAYWEVVFEDEL